MISHSASIIGTFKNAPFNFDNAFCYFAVIKLWHGKRMKCIYITWAGKDVLDGYVLHMYIKAHLYFHHTETSKGWEIQFESIWLTPVTFPYKMPRNANSHLKYAWELAGVIFIRLWSSVTYRREWTPAEGQWEGKIQSSGGTVKSSSDWISSQALSKWHPVLPAWCGESQSKAEATVSIIAPKMGTSCLQ